MIPNGLTVVPTNGTNDGTLTVTVTENTNIVDRVGTITITGGGITRTVTLTQQSAPMLTVTPLEQYLSNGEGNTTFAITSTRDWAVEDDSEWLTVVPTNGTNDGTLTVTVTENTGIVDRVGTITITGGGITRTVTLTQQSTPMLAVTPLEQYLSNGEGSTTFGITSTREWAVEDDSEWLTVVPTNGTNDGILTVTVTENTNTVDRVGTITITGGGITRTVTVRQESAAFLTITPKETFVSKLQGSSTLTISTNKNWVAVDNADWLTLSPESGSNNGIVTAAYTENPDTIQRTVKITAAVNGIIDSVTITQEAKSFLTISSPHLVLPRNSGSTTLVIESNTDWQLNEELDWLSLSKNIGSNSETIIVNYSSNQKVTSRQGLISILGDDISIEVSVYQEAGDVHLIITPNSKVVNADSGRIVIQVESNTKWQIQDNFGWISVSPNSGTGNSSIIVSYLANQDSLIRNGNLFFTADSVAAKHTLMQQGLEVFEITALTDSLISGNTSGSGRYLYGSLAKVIASPNQGWIFKNWSENNTIISTDSSYSFLVSSNRILVANFKKILTNVKDEYQIADHFELFQNYPNPFNPETIFRFAVPKAGFVSVSVYSAFGEKIRDLVAEYLEPGIYNISFNGENLASGMYICRMQSESFVRTRKMLLVK